MVYACLVCCCTSTLLGTRVTQYALIIQYIDVVYTHLIVLSKFILFA